MMLSPWRPVALTRSQQEERRLQGQQFLEQGDSHPHEIAAALGVAHSTVRVWAKKLRELNPIELVWAYVKRHVLGNVCLRSVKELRSWLRRAWQRVRYRQLALSLIGPLKCGDLVPQGLSAGPA